MSKRKDQPAAAPPAQTPYCDMCFHDLEYRPKNLARCVICYNLVKDWEKAPDWATLVRYNLEFIAGQRKATSYSYAPIFLQPLIQRGLFRLHDYGLLVVDAQPETYLMGQEVEGRFRNQWYEIKERAYIRFVLPTQHPDIPPEKIDDLLYLLLATKPLECVIYSDYGEWGPGLNDKSGRFAYPVEVLEEYRKSRAAANVRKQDMFHCNVGPSSADRYTVKYRCAKNKEDLAWQKWRRCNRNALPIVSESEIDIASKGTRALGKECKMSREMKPVVVTVASREWPPGMGSDLVKLVDVCCQAAGLEKAFEGEVRKYTNVLVESLNLSDAVMKELVRRFPLDKVEGN